MTAKDHAKWPPAIGRVNKDKRIAKAEMLTCLENAGIFIAGVQEKPACKR